MKTLIVLFFILCSYSAQARVNAGAIAGINRSSPSVTFKQGSTNAYSALIGWNFGAIFDWNKEEKLSLRQALQFQRTGLSTSGESARTIQIDYLHLPVWGKLKLSSFLEDKNRGYLLLGAFIATPIFSRVNYETLQNTSASLSGIRSIDAGWSMGIGTELKTFERNLPFELVYFSSLTSADKSNKNNSYKNQTLQLQVGVWF